MGLTVALALGLGASVSNLAQPGLAQEAPTTISSRALATHVIPGYADFLAADGDAVWTTNEGRVEKLRHDRSSPVASVPIPEPCGAMSVAFHALWVANCSDSSVYRIDLKTRKVAAVVRSGLADPSGELSLTDGAGSVWVLTDDKRILSRVDPETNQIVARIEVARWCFSQPVKAASGR